MSAKTRVTNIIKSELFIITLEQEMVNSKLDTLKAM